VCISSCRLLLSTVPMLFSSVIWARLLLELLQDDDCVLTAESEAVGDGYAHIHAPHFVGHVVEVAIGIRGLVVDSRVHETAVHHKQGRDRLHCSRSTQKMAQHRL